MPDVPARRRPPLTAFTARRPRAGQGRGIPEGHTIHRLARLHRRRFGGHPVALSSPQGRFATDAEIVAG
ncbi:MAG: hypothetical protein ABS81_10145 [Pseudonocardia sp. SCN 72-86]|nr:MAG: hypothetical protein ABS81_10145 [Pseudonocardia sp. SCN 72-86]